MVSAAVVFTSCPVLCVAVWVGAELLRMFKPGWRDATTPVTMIFTRMAQSFSACALVLSIQLWVSLRWNTFAPGLALVIVAVMVMLDGVSRASSRATLVKFYPWAMSVTAIAHMSEPSNDRALVAAVGLAGGLIV